MTHDTTLRRHASIEPSGHGIAIGALHPAYRYARTIFPSRVFDPSEVKRVLKDGSQNRKIGREVRKGKRRGWPIYMLTLEERATCPRSCKVWGECYGNQSQASERIVAGAELEERLWLELGQLQAEHPRGFMVRLHVLGDFYSEAYVRLWERALDEFPALHVFGYTAHLPGSDIGHLIHWLGIERWDRFAVRFSGLGDPRKGAVLVDADESTPHLVCPAQTGKTDCCGTCALCWHSDRTIAFLRH